ncbi:MAG TPA: DinB family protein [Candidatus Limnocylindrales bacterium]|nr:DinB family protein [Candidatus Limnocylindrales bacterium]
MSEGASTDRRAIRDAYAAVADRLASAAHAVARRPTPAGEWKPTDVVRHLIAVELEVWQPRLLQVAAEDDPHWPWAEPDRWLGEPGATLDELLARFAAGRAETIAHVDALDDAGWARIGTHATFGVLDVAGLLQKALDHDEEHLASLEA